MSVFRKLKDVLFDIEEEEIPVITKTERRTEVRQERPVMPEANPIKEVKMPVDDFYEEPKTVPREPVRDFHNDFDDVPVTRTRTRFSEDLFDEDDFLPPKKPTPKPEEKKEVGPRMDYSKFLKEQPKKKETRPFTLSPVISPVYGILDQNYTKDDVIVRNDKGIGSPDLDEVRKKAYGIEDKKVKKEVAVKPSVKEEHLVDEFEEPLKNLDSILDDDILDFDLNPKKEVNVKKDDISKPVLDNIEDDEDDNSLEKDLFNLIDSMYEDKEESEEE